MSEKATKRSKRLTMKQGMELYKTLLECTEKDGEYIKYKADVHDGVVAKQHGFSIGQVSKFRAENVGKFRPQGNPNPTGARTNTLTVLSKVEQLERKFVVLNAKYNDLMVRHNKLCTALSLNRVYIPAKDYAVPEVDNENK